MSARAPAFTAAKKNDEIGRLRRKMWAGFRFLGMDEDEGARRAFLQTTVGASSSKRLNRNELRYVIRALERKGFDSKARSNGFRKPLKDHSKKIWALWFSLREADAIETATGAALRAWIRRMMAEEREQGITVTGDPDLLDPEDAQWIIESLKNWCRRVGAEVD